MSSKSSRSEQDQTPKRAQGFALLSQAERVEISSIGGKQAHVLGVGHEWTPETAALAGKKGGIATAAKRRALKVNSSIRSGGIQPQHSRRALKVRTSVKAGGFDPTGNHNPIALALAAVLRKAGRIRRGLNASLRSASRGVRP